MDNLDGKSIRATNRAIIKGNTERAQRTRDGILRYFGVVLHLSRRNVGEIRPQLYRLRTLHAHTGEQATHSANLEVFFDVLRPHDDELGCMDVVFEHLVQSSFQDQSHRGDYLSGGYENRTVNMYEVLALLTVVRYGSLEKKLQILHELFETSQYCKAGLYFQHDVYHPTQLLGNQPLAEDEVSFMVVSITRALALSGISNPASFHMTRRTVAGALDVPNAGASIVAEEGETKHGQISAAQLLAWAQTDPTPLALQEMLAMAPRLERLLKRFDGLMRLAEHATGHLEATPMRSRGHGDDDSARLTSVEAHPSVGPVVLHRTETSATIFIQMNRSCVLTCRVRPRHRPPPGPPPELKDEITTEVDLGGDEDEQSFGSVDSGAVGTQWGGTGDGDADGSLTLFELSTFEDGEPSVEETLRTGTVPVSIENSSVGSHTFPSMREPPALPSPSGLTSVGDREASVLTGDASVGGSQSHTIEYDTFDIEQSCRAGEATIFTVPGLEPSKEYITLFLQKCHGADPCVAFVSFSTTAPIKGSRELVGESDNDTQSPPLEIEYGARWRSAKTRWMTFSDTPSPIKISLGNGVQLRTVIKKWLKVLQCCSDCSAQLSPMERVEVVKTASRGAMKALHKVASDTLLDNMPNKRSRTAEEARKAKFCHLSLSLVPQIPHILPRGTLNANARVMGKLQSIINLVYEDIWLTMRGGLNTSASTPTLRDLTSISSKGKYIFVPAVDWGSDLGGSRSGGIGRYFPSIEKGASGEVSASTHLSAWSRRQAFLSELEALLASLTAERVGDESCLVLLAPRPILPSAIHAITSSSTDPFDITFLEQSSNASAPQMSTPGAVKNVAEVSSGATFTQELGSNGQKFYVGTAAVERIAANASPAGQSSPFLHSSKFAQFEAIDTEQEEVPLRRAQGFQISQADDKVSPFAVAESEAAAKNLNSGSSNIDQIKFLMEAPQRAAEAAAKLEDQSLEKLLLMLTAWRASHPAREVVILCGGCRVSVVSRAKNSLTGEIVEQYSFGEIQQVRGKKRALPIRSELGVFQIEHKASVPQISKREPEKRTSGYESMIDNIADTLIVIPQEPNMPSKISLESSISLKSLKDNYATQTATKEEMLTTSKVEKVDDEARVQRNGDGSEGGDAALNTETRQTNREHSKNTTVLSKPANRLKGLPKVRVGPIVGKVTDRSAVLLLELERSCTVTAIAMDCCSGARYECRSKLHVGSAHTFRFDGMMPDTPHFVFFLGISDADDERHHASFRTLQTNPTALNVHCLFREKFEASRADNIKLWEWLDEDAQSPRSRADLNLIFLADIISDTTLSEVQTMVHLFMRDDDEDDHAQFLRAKEWLREKFALALTEPRLRRVLAHAPSLMMPGCWRLNNKVMQEYGSQCGCIMEALFDDVVAEYQSQLWGQSDHRPARLTYMKPGATDEHNFVIPVLNSHQRFFRHGSVGILTLTCMPSEPQMKNQHHHGATAVNETFVYRFGLDQLTDLRTLLVDTLHGHISSTDRGSLVPLTLLLIACELPVINNNDAYHCDKKEVHALLTLLFQWKKKMPRQRRFALVCAGGISPGETRIIDGKSALWDTQIILPAMVVPSSLLAKSSVEANPVAYGINDSFRWITTRFAGVNHGYAALSLVADASMPTLPMVEKLFLSTDFLPAVALFGPLIGEVTETSVRILLEVETTLPVEITCTIKSTRDGKGPVPLKRLALSQVPILYEFIELEPDTSYNVTFAPLRDANQHTGWFRTMKVQPSVLQLCFMTGSDPLGQLATAFSSESNSSSDFLRRAVSQESFHRPHLVKASLGALGYDIIDRQYAWNDIFNRSFLPERAHDIVIHLGGFTSGQIVRGAADDAHDNLQNTRAPEHGVLPRPKKSAFAGLSKSDKLRVLETGADELVQRLRDAYRCAYSAPGYRNMVRGTGHLLMMHEDEQNVQMRYSAGRMQRHPAIMKHMKYASSDYRQRLESPTYLKIKTKNDESGENDDIGAGGGKESKEESETDGPLEEKEGKSRTLVADDSNNERTKAFSYHQRGSIGILSIYFTSSERTKMWTCDQAVFDALERVLKKKELTAVIICTHIPLVPQRLQYIETTHEGGSIKEQEPIPYSTVEPSILQLLLEQLFEWIGRTRAQDGSFRRNICIVAGTFQAGCMTEVTDNSTGAVIMQICTGRPRASVSRTLEIVPYGVIGERFSYTHSLPLDLSLLKADSWPYAEVKVLTEPSKSILVTSLMPMREQAEGLQLVVGPILGPFAEEMSQSRASDVGLELQPGGPTTAYENSFSISVLVEFNQDALIECTLSEVFTHEVITHAAEIKAGHPHAFRLKGLGGERRFRVTFRGQPRYASTLSPIKSAETIFSTPAPQECEFTCALVSGDNIAGLGSYKEKNPWENLVEHGEAYIPRVNLVIHLGGQVGDMQPIIYEMLAYIRERTPIEDASDSVEVEQKMTDACVRERLRRTYRDAWNMPTKKKVLRGNQHLMLCGELDIFKFYSELHRFCSTLEGKEKELSAVRRVTRLAVSVQREYQRQLWDENWEAETPLSNEACFHLFRRNQVGLFFFDVHEVNPEGQVFTAAGDIQPKTKEEEEEEEAEAATQAAERPPTPDWQLLTDEMGWISFPGSEQVRIESEFQKGSATTWRDEGATSYTIDLVEMLETKNKSGDAPRQIRRDDKGWAAKLAAEAHAAETGWDPFMPKSHTVSDTQWSMLKNAMETPDLMVLIVASDVPFVWESDQGIKDQWLRESAARQARNEGEWDNPDDPATEDSDKYCKAAWMYAPDQTKLLLKILFEWKAEVPGREVILAGGTGRGGYGGTDTTVTFWPNGELLPDTIQQLTAGPITDSPYACEVPTERGRIYDQFEFQHVQQQQRNYGIIVAQVGNDKYGAMCRTEGRILPFKAGAKTFRPRNDLLVPTWLKNRLRGDPVVYIEDEIWLRAREDEGCNGVESFVAEVEFAASCRELYREFHLDDFPRPENLRFINMKDPVTLRVYFIRACTKLWTLLPLHVQAACSDLSDPYVLEMLFKKVVRGTLIFDDADAFSKFCVELVYTASILRLAALQTVTIEADEPEPVESDEEVEMEDTGVGPDGEPLSPMTAGSNAFPEGDALSILTGERGDIEGSGKGSDKDDSDEEKPPAVGPSLEMLEKIAAEQALQQAEEMQRADEEHLEEEAAVDEDEPMSPIPTDVNIGETEEQRKEYDSEGNEIDPNENLMQNELDELEDMDEVEHQRRMQDPYTIAALNNPKQYREKLKAAKRLANFEAWTKRQKKQPIKLKQWNYDRLIDPTLSDDDDIDDDNDEEGKKKKKKKKKEKEKKKKKKDNEQQRDDPE